MSKTLNIEEGVKKQGSQNAFNLKRSSLKIITKEARIYNGEKTASSVSGAGKTGQPHVKE